MIGPMNLLTRPDRLPRARVARSPSGVVSSIVVVEDATRDACDESRVQCRPSTSPAFPIQFASPARICGVCLMSEGGCHRCGRRYDAAGVLFTDVGAEEEFCVMILSSVSSAAFSGVAFW